MEPILGIEPILIVVVVVLLFGGGLLGPASRPLAFRSGWTELRIRR